jgi:hypothetical protein
MDPQARGGLQQAQGAQLHALAHQHAEVDVQAQQLHAGVDV